MTLLRYLTLSISFLMTQNLFAWGEIGHGAVGFIAEQNLTPKAKALVYQIMGPEPLAISARWSDLVKSDRRFDPFEAYHYIEIPEGQRFKDLKKRAARDADTILRQVPSLLTKKDIDNTQKAIFLRFLAHVVGDVHQPLHIGNGVDRGATQCMVMWRNPETKKWQKAHLHSVWDDKLFINLAEDFHRQNLNANGLRKWFGYKEFTEIILKEFSKEKDLNYEKAQHASIEDWYQESQDLQAQVYPDSRKTSAKDREYCKSEATDSKSKKLPKLDQAYVQRSLPILKRQIILAGYRLAGLLNRASEALEIEPWSQSLEENLLKKVLISNAASEPPPHQQ